MERLIIFDLNGVIGQKIDSFKRKLSENEVRCGNYIFRLFPGAKDFISYCLKHYSVAIWTSTSGNNASSIVSLLFTMEEQKQLEFTWYRDFTKLDPDYNRNPSIEKFDTIKDLNDLFLCPKFNRKWNSENTLLIDDSYQKTRFNSARNVIILNNPSNETFEQLKFDLEALFSDLQNEER